MSTRGYYGFHRNGKDKGSYCQSDAYPSWLGKSIFGYVKSRTPEQMAATFDAIKMVEDDEKPTKKQMARVLAANKAREKAGLEPLCDLSVAGQHREEDEWYCLLRKAQGCLEPLDDLPFMTRGMDFLADSVSNVWSYIINLDEQVLEVYSGGGGNKDKAAPGRYAHLSEAGYNRDNGYFGVVRILRIPFAEIATMSVEDFVTTAETAKTEWFRKPSDILKAA